MKYQFIAEHQQEYPVKTMCWVLEVAVSGTTPGCGGWARPAAAARRTRGWGSALCVSIRPIARSTAVRAFTRCCEAKGSTAGASESRGS